MEGKVCFISDAGSCRGQCGHLFKGWRLLTGSQWGKSFYRQKEGATCKNSSQFLPSQVSSAPPFLCVITTSFLFLGACALEHSVVSKLVIGGLTSIILDVLGTVNLHF